MNKEFIEDKALLYALGTLPSDEEAEFESLIRKDRAVRDFVHESQLLNELDATESPSVEPPFQVYSRIMAQIDPVESASASAADRSKSRRVSFLAWGGWATAACAAVALSVAVYRLNDMPTADPDIVLNNLANPRLVAVTPPSDDFGIEDRMLELAGLAEAYWFSREGVPTGQRLVESDTEVAQLSGGFTIFDRKYNIGFIAVENMPQETDGKSYHVWAKTRHGSQAVRAGALPIGDESRGLFFFDLSALPDATSIDAVEFFVTEESSEDPQKPSEAVVLSGF